MLEQLEARRARHGLSLRKIADELGVSHTLLSLVLARKRKPSKALLRRIEGWLNNPVSCGSPNAPGQAVIRFISERASHLSPSTVRFYEQKLMPFASWCERKEVMDVRVVDRSQISDFLAEIRDGRRQDKNGHRRRLNNGALKLHHQCLKTFFAWLAETASMPDDWSNPVAGIHVKASQAQTMEFSPDELCRMYEAIERSPDDVLRLRNRAIIKVLLNSAARASELLGMNVADVAPDGRVKVTGKGSKQRIVTVGRSGVKAIQAYLAARGDTGGALWQTHGGSRLTADGLRAMFARLEQSDPRHFSDGVFAHRFRHTAVTRLLRARVPLRSVQRYAGHTSSQTTLRYAQALDAAEAIETIDTLELAGD